MTRKDIGIYSAYILRVSGCLQAGKHGAVLSDGFEVGRACSLHFLWRYPSRVPHRKRFRQRQTVDEINPA